MAAAPINGDYAMAKAAAQRAYEQAQANIAARKGKTLQRYGYDTGGNVDGTNKYGSYQMIQKSYDDAKAAMQQDSDRFSSEYGIKLDGQGGYSQDGSDGVLQRMGQDHQTVLDRLMDARNKTEFASGLKGRYDAQGNPQGLSLSLDNQHGALQRMLGQQGESLDAAEEAGMARGIGGRGLGAQAAGRVGFQAAGQRQDLRTNLVDMLTGNARNAQDENTDYSRNTKDMDKSIRDALADMMKSGKDLDFQKGKDEYDMGNSLADMLAGLDQESYGAQTDYQNSNMDAAIAAALSGNTGTAPGPKAAGPQSKRETPAQRALRLRSEGMNKRYGRR